MIMGIYERFNNQSYPGHANLIFVLSAYITGNQSVVKSDKSSLGWLISHGYIDESNDCLTDQGQSVFDSVEAIFAELT